MSNFFSYFPDIIQKISLNKSKREDPRNPEGFLPDNGDKNKRNEDKRQLLERDDNIPLYKSINDDKNYEIDSNGDIMDDDIDSMNNNLSLNDELDTLDTLDKIYTDTSVTIDILDILKSYYKNTDDNNDDAIAVHYVNNDKNKQKVIVKDVNTVNDITKKFNDFCSKLVNIIQEEVIKSKNYKDFQIQYKEYLNLKKKQGDKNRVVTDKYNKYNLTLNNIFEGIKKNMSTFYIKIYPDDPNKTEFNHRLIVCFSNNQDNKKKLNRSKTSFNSNREFIKRFLEYFKKPNNENNENASNYSNVTKSRSLPTITSEFAVPAGNTYIQNGTDLNEMLINNYFTRIKYNLYEPYESNITIENNNWNSIKRNIDNLFNHFTANVYNKIEVNSTNDLPVELNNLYNKETFKYKYIKAKFIIDVGDLMHDVFKIPFLENNSYFQGIKFLASNLLGDSSQSIISELDDCYANTIIEIYERNFKNVNQVKTHDMRTKAITNLQKEIVETNNKLLLPNIETRLLGQREGYFELIKHIYNISNGPTKFVYSESGRNLDTIDIANYFGNLDDDKKEEFLTECLNYCDYDDEKKNTIETLLTETLLTNPPILSVQTETYPISSFDGCGGSSKIDKKTPDNIEPAIFNYVFGYYKYTVYSVYNNNTEMFYHLVVVTIQEDKSQSIQVQAIFGFWGNITINMLLKAVDIPRSRLGEGDKGGLISIKEVSILLLNKNPNLLTIYTGVQPFNIEETEYYASSITDIGLKNLLLLGNKTIGDLIFTTYKGVYAVTTVDSFIGDSTMYNFLSGNSDILQSVWMQTGGKGWKFTPGLFKPNNETKATFISTQLLSSFMFLKAFSKFIDTTSPSKLSSQPTLYTIQEGEEEQEDNSVMDDSQISEASSNNGDQYGPLKNLITKYNNIIKKITQIDCSAIEPLERFNSLMNYRLSDFDNIKNYTSVDNFYNTCMVQLLIYENYSIKMRIFEYIKKLSKYIDDSNPTNITTFLNDIYTLPKLDTFFTSNISTLASNNAESYDINDLFKLFKPELQFDLPVSIGPVQIPKIDIKIENQYINISYYIKSAPPPKDVFEKDGYSESEIKYTEPKKNNGDRSNPFWNLEFQLPYTIETLIKLYLTNKLKDKDKQDIKNRIVSFFKNSIDSVQINNAGITNVLYNNLNELLKSVNILNESDNLQNIDGVDFNDDEEDCGDCADGALCDANDVSKKPSDTMDTEGGTRKNKRKQPKKYKSYNRKSKSKKHNKSKNKRKPNKTQRKPNKTQRKPNKTQRKPNKTQRKHK